MLNSPSGQKMMRKTCDHECYFFFVRKKEIYDSGTFTGTNPYPAEFLK